MVLLNSCIPLTGILDCKSNFVLFLQRDLKQRPRLEKGHQRTIKKFSLFPEKFFVYRTAVT